MLGLDAFVFSLHLPRFPDFFVTFRILSSFLLGNLWDERRWNDGHSLILVSTSWKRSGSSLSFTSKWDWNLPERLTVLLSYIIGAQDGGWRWMKIRNINSWNLAWSHLCPNLCKKNWKDKKGIEHLSKENINKNKRKKKVKNHYYLREPKLLDF